MSSSMSRYWATRESAAGNCHALCTPHLGFVALDQLVTNEISAEPIRSRYLAFEAGQPIDVINPDALAKSAVGIR